MPEPAVRRLIIDRIDSDFDPARDIVLGRWCFVGCEDIAPDWETLPVPEPYDDADDLCAVAAAADALTDRHLAAWAARLNARHGVDYSLAFWRPLLVLWICEVVHFVLSRYRSVARFLEAHPADEVVVGVWPDPDGTFRSDDILAFYYGVLVSRRFNIWVVSRLLEALAGPNVDQVPMDHPPAEPAAPPPRPAPRSGLRGLVARRNAILRANLSQSMSAFTTGLKVRSIAVDVAFDLFLRALPRKAPAPATPLDRPAPVSVPIPEAVEAIVEQALAATLPAYAGDGFAALARRAQPWRIRPGKLSVRVAGFALDTAQAYRQAMALEQGEGLVSLQHGGNYGMPRLSHLARELEYPQRAMLTWGWEAQGRYRGSFVAVPAPMLAPLRDRHRERERSAILVGTAVALLTGRVLHVAATIGTRRYYETKRQFLDGVRPDVFEALWYRPYPESRLFARDESRWTRAYPALKICGDDFPVRLLRCRLAVLDHPVTTLPIALAANVPTVAFWDPRHWPMSPEAEPLFDGLRSVGILHDDGAAAAQQVNAVWDDVADWWRRPEVQAARRAWCRQYARTSPVWWWHVAHALWRL